MPQSWVPEKLKLNSSRETYKTFQTNTKKEILFIIGDWNAKVENQEIPGVTDKFGLGIKKWGRAKVNRVLPTERIGHSKHTLRTTQETTLYMDIMRWSILKSDWLHSLQPKWSGSTQSAKTRLGADCGSYHELLIVKFRLKLRRVGKTTRPLRYDLNQIPYGYKVEVTDRFKG